MAVNVSAPGDGAGGPLAGRTVLYVVSEDGYFLSHRLPMARAAMAAGARVAVAASDTGDGAAIRAHGFGFHPIPFDRSGMSPARDAGTLIRLTGLIRRMRPDVVHAVALKPALYAGLAARAPFAGTRPPAVVCALAGLGYVFSSDDWRARILRPAVRWLLRRACAGPRARMLAQNGDDAAMMADMGMAADKITVIRGSGVDVVAFHPAETPPPGPPDAPMVAVCASRMLWDKGIGELAEAARRLRAAGAPVEVHLAGEADPRNPASIPPARLEAWAREGIVTLLGQRKDMASVYRAAHVGVLPSRREGLPMALLEAAACGLPIVATDAPGCREICADGETGLRVPPRDPAGLAAALDRLARDADLRARLGAGARAAAVRDFSSTVVGGRTVALYRDMLASL